MKNKLFLSTVLLSVFSLFLISCEDDSDDGMSSSVGNANVRVIRPLLSSCRLLLPVAAGVRPVGEDPTSDESRAGFGGHDLRLRFS